MNTRAVVIGKETVYMGKVLGGLYLDRFEVKGCPKSWVDSTLKKSGKEHTRKIVEGMAAVEEASNPFQPGKKMKGGAFWRNALGYLNGKGDR